ncbi:MAG TPA: tetratricopeptide repeat protein [Bryobacteraceae bacterium]|nr:tetratricopeptide repeat protein [Bryobacteraceae bacterium]
MHPRKLSLFVLTLTLALSLAGGIACNKSKDSEVSAAALDTAKIPITTTSEEAKKEFLLGRDLSDRLLGQESLQHFERAVALDPDFASAELALAMNAVTAKDFFDHQKRAMSLADKVSEGEKLLILANEAGANGDVTKQKDYLEKLVASFPNDERARFGLANYYFGQQEMEPAIEHYKKATELAPGYSPAYNVLGYAYRQQGDYADAEQAFKKYIELIPNDPNPYDSYAELLLKMGRFDDSLTQYHRALSIDPKFNPSHFGIAADQMYRGKSQEATAELQKMADQARNDGELRTAFFGMAVVAADRGKMDQALQAMDKEFAVAEKKNDVASMAADLQAKGNILVEMPNYDEAKREFDRSLQLIQTSNLSQDIKDNATLLHHYDMAGIAIAKKDYAAAKTHAEEFRRGAEASKNSLQVEQAHELAGRIALAEKDNLTAVAELEQANLQDPRNLYRLSLAYEGKGDTAKAQEFLTKAAEYNSLPQLNYAFVRTKAQKKLGDKKAS